MKLIHLFGPQAVGKMTVGQELEKITDLKLFHNHMTIDLVAHFFDYSTKEGQSLVNSFRQQIFEAVAKSSLYGMIFTYVWFFDKETDKEYVENLTKLFEEHGAEVCYVELEADLDTRLSRNVTENRLHHKAKKRDIDWSTNDVISSTEKHRLNSLPGEISYPNYLRINNTNLSAKEVAQQIKQHFKL